jgi:hypothetical protein
LRYAFKLNKISYIYSFSFHFSIEKKGIFRKKIVRIDDNVLIKIGHVNYIKIWIGMALHPYCLFSLNLGARYGFWVQRR